MPKSVLLVPTLMILLLLTACTANSFIPITETSITNYEKQEELVEIEDDKILEVWTPENIFVHSIHNYQDRFPDVKVEINDQMDRNTLVTQYRSSLVSKKTPDIFVIPNDFLGTFTSINGFENVLEEPYYDPIFLEDRPEGLLHPYINSEKDEMTIVPLIQHPFVAYYRADILEEHGYPSDPDELGVYMNDVNNWFTMARDLKDKGYYLLDTELSLLDILIRGNYYIDETHQYLGDSKEWMDIQKAAIKIREEQLSLNRTIWDMEAQEAIREDKLIMFLGPSYMESHLQSWAPDQAGKWAITTLPFELAGMDNQVSLSIAISSQSEEKLLAWEFVKQMSNDMLGMYKGIRKDNYFKNENLQRVYWDVLSKPPFGKPHMFDEEIQMLWDLTLKNFHWGKPFTIEEMESFHRDIKDKILYEQQLLQKFEHSQKYMEN